MTLEERGFRRMLRLRGRDLRLLSGPSGATFRGTINRIGAYALDGNLGEDPRGKRILETAAAGCPDLSSQNVIRDEKNGEQFRVTNIGLDAPDYSRKFELFQLTGSDT